MKIVGANHQPRSGRSHATLRRTASRSPSDTSASIRSSCSDELIAPTSVFLSSGSPIRSRPIAPRACRSPRRPPTPGSAGASRAAHVALVEEDPVDDPFDRLVERGILEDDVGGLAAQLEREQDAAAGQRRLDVLATAVEPVKATLSIPGSRTRWRPPRPSPGSIETTPGGSSASWMISARSSAVSGLRRLEHRRVPQASAGASFHAAISNGKFQGTICPATPSSSTAGRAVRQLVRPARVVEEVRRGGGTSTSRDSRIGLPPSSDSTIASSRARSWISRAMRNELARSRPLRAAQPAWAARADSTAARMSAGRRRPPRPPAARWPG